MSRRRREDLREFSEEEQHTLTWTGALSKLAWNDSEVKTVYLSDVDFPVYVSRHVFKNEDGSLGVLYLASDDKTLSHTHTLELYQRWWSVKEYHKSLKRPGPRGGQAR